MATICPPSQEDNAPTDPDAVLSDGEQYPVDNGTIGPKSTNSTPNRDGGDPGTPRSGTITPASLTQSPPRVRPQVPNWPTGYTRCFQSALDGQVEHLFRARWRPSAGAYGVPQAEEQIENLVALLVKACRDTENVLDDGLHASYFEPGGMWMRDPKDIEAICWNLVQKTISIHVDGAYGLQWNHDYPSPRNGNATLTFPQRVFVLNLLLKHYKIVAHSMMLQQNVEETIVLVLTRLFVDNKFKEALSEMHGFYKDEVANHLRNMGVPSTPRSELTPRRSRYKFEGGQWSQESTPCKGGYEFQDGQDSPSTPRRRAVWSPNGFHPQTPPIARESEAINRNTDFQGEQGSPESTLREGSYEYQDIQDSPSTQRRAQWSPKDVDPQTPPAGQELKVMNMQNEFQDGNVSQETTSRNGSDEFQDIQDSPSAQLRAQWSPSDPSSQTPPAGQESKAINIQNGHLSQETSRNGWDEFQGSQNLPSTPQRRAHWSPEDINPQSSQNAREFQTDNNVLPLKDVDWDTWMQF